MCVQAAVLNILQAMIVWCKRALKHGNFMPAKFATCFPWKQEHHCTCMLDHNHCNNWHSLLIKQVCSTNTVKVTCLQYNTWFTCRVTANHPDSSDLASPAKIWNAPDPHSSACQKWVLASSAALAAWTTQAGDMAGKGRLHAQDGTHTGRDTHTTGHTHTHTHTHTCTHQSNSWTSQTAQCNDMMLQICLSWGCMK